MALSKIAVASLLLTSSVLATPLKKRGFSSPAKRWSPGSGIHTKRDDGAVVANNDGGGWIIPVLIGGQQMILNLDTGSSDLWTASTLLSQDVQNTVTSGAIFDPSQSSTFSYMDGSNYSLGYADGSGSSGPVGIDTVNVGGASVTMPFGVCSDLRYGGDGSGTRDTDGPVGLGFGAENSIRPNPQCTFVECVSEYLDAPIFSTYFKTDDSGSIAFGYADSSLYTGDITSIPIDNSTGQWFSNDVQFGSGGNVFSADPIQMDFDTGTASLSISSDAAAGYFGLVSGAGQNSDGSWYYPCGQDLPDFDYVFSNVNSGPTTVTIPGNNLKNGDGDAGSNCGTWISITTGGGNAGLPFYISKYMMFNQADPSLSFADQA